MIFSFLDMGKEDHALVGSDRVDKVRTFEVHTLENGLFGIGEKTIHLSTGDEQHSLLEPAPAAIDEIFRRSVMIREQDRMDASLLRIRQHFGQRATGVVRVLGVRVEDAAIVVHTGAGRTFNPL